MDNTYILDAINSKRDETYKSLLEKEMQQHESIKIIALNDLENKLRQDYEELRTEKDRLSLLVGSFDEKLESEIKWAKSIIDAEFIVEKGKLESKIDELNREMHTQKTIAIFETEKIKDAELNAKQEYYSNQVAEKQREIDSLINQLKALTEKQEILIEKEVAIIKQTLGEQISQKEIEINQLRLSKSNLQVKMLGEELERWFNNEYESFALSGFENCKWFKDNKSVKDAPDLKGAKADYIFEVYASSQKTSIDKLLSVCCEMKNESPDTKNKTKNSDYFKKLEDDRVKKNCQYSLLISELEWDSANDAPIRKIPGYENTYMARLAYFISFLSLINSLANKYQDLLVEHRVADDNFEDSQAIIEEFEGFKTSYLDKPLTSLLKDVEEIKKEANKAYESPYKIIGLADSIISNKISEIKVKIDRIDIKKIARKIDKISKM